MNVSLGQWVRKIAADRTALLATGEALLEEIRSPAGNPVSTETIDAFATAIAKARSRENSHVQE